MKKGGPKAPRSHDRDWCHSAASATVRRLRRKRETAGKLTSASAISALSALPLPLLFLPVQLTTDTSLRLFTSLP